MVGPPASSRRERAVTSFVPEHRRSERVVRCVFGLALFGFGITLLLRAELGAAPWDVFHTGVNELTGVPTGVVIVVTGLALLALWIPLRERPGLGTILNAIEIGLVVDLTLPIVPEVDRLLVRGALLVAGLVLIAVGSGFYIGAGLGPGPRDGLMTGLAKRSVRGRSISVRVARTFVELVVLAVGIALGGSIGIGTAAFALGIGPLVQFFLPRLTVGATDRAGRARPGEPAESTVGGSP